MRLLCRLKPACPFRTLAPLHGRGLVDHRRTIEGPVCELTYRMHRRVTLTQFLASSLPFGGGTWRACGAFSRLRLHLPFDRQGEGGFSGIKTYRTSNLQEKKDAHPKNEE